MPLPAGKSFGQGGQELSQRDCVPGDDEKVLVFESAPKEDGGIIEELLKEEGALALDEILEATGLEPAQLPGMLLQLEFSKKILRTPDGRYSLLS